jgi:signal transduction histidine kinase
VASAAWKETLSLLTRGLAHDLNNQLSCVVSLSELTATQLGPEHPCTQALNLIKKGGLRASQILQRLGQLHRSQTGQREFVNCSQAVGEAAELAQMILSRRVHVRTELPDATLAVHLDVAAFRQVLLELALNAGDAMPNGGILTFHVSSPTSAPALTHFRGTLPPLPCVCVSVQDHGQGITAHLLPRIFEPFFTTNPAKGCGVGLFNAVRFVENHQGAISVESTEGQGATFRLWLPQADLGEPPATTSPSSTNPTPRP